MIQLIKSIDEFACVLCKAPVKCSRSISSRRYVAICGDRWRGNTDEIAPDSQLVIGRCVQLISVGGRSVDGRWFTKWTSTSECHWRLSITNWFAIDWACRMTVDAQFLFLYKQDMTVFACRSIRFMNVPLSACVRAFDASAVMVQLESLRGT